jgi:tetratricopeptide (TPR) repeat protein
MKGVVMENEKPKNVPENVNEFIAQHRVAIASNPECGTSHYNLAVGLLGQKQYAEAEQALFKAIECSPSLAEAYVLLGGIRLKDGDLDGCLDFNQKAVKARPGFSEGYGNIGFVQLQKGNVDKAIQALERATAFNFRFLQAFTTLASAYLMKGHVDKSIEAGLKAIKLEPNFPVAHNNLAIAYLQKGAFDLAKRHCDKAIELGYQVAPEIIKDISDKRH